MSTAAMAHVSAPPGSCLRAMWRWDLGVIALVAGLPLVYFTGVVSSDDVGYLDVVWRRQQGLGPSDPQVSQFFARFTLWKLIHLAVVLVPGQPWAMALPSLASALAVLLILRALARRHLEPPAVLVAMLAFGLVPINVALASIALPEMLGTALAWGAVYLVAAALLNRETPRAGWRCLAGGLLIAVGYNAKETVAFFGPGLILFVLLGRVRCLWAWKRAAFLAVGAGLWLTFEAIVFWHWTGDPLYHLHVLARSQRVYLGSPVDRPLAAALTDSADYLRWLADPRSVFGPMGQVLLAGLVFAAVKRTPFSNLLLCLLVPSLIYLSAGSTDLGQYHPIIHQPRYLVPLLPGMALLAAMMIGRIWQLGRWGRAAVAVAAIPVLAFSLLGPNQLAGRWYNAKTFTAGYRLIASNVHLFKPGDRLCAAGLSHNRFYGLPHWLDCPQVEMIQPGPTTPEAWIDRHGGAYVMTTRADRRGPSRAKHSHLTLQGRSIECLRGFERVARRAPPRDRLTALWARFRRLPAPTDPEHAVDLWRVPTGAEWEVSRSSRKTTPLAPGRITGTGSDSGLEPPAVPF